MERLSEDVQDSVLYSVKKELGLSPDYTAFDQELILHINSVFAILYQLGVGPKQPYTIRDGDDSWQGFTRSPELVMVKTYMYLKVRLLFDPPSSATMFQAMNDQVDEYEWRLLVAADELASEGGDDDERPHVRRSLHRVVSLRSTGNEVGRS